MVAGLFSKGLLLLGLCSLGAAQNGSKPLYKNPDAPVNDRVDDLLSRMTIEDKMGQLIQGAFLFVCFWGMAHLLIPTGDITNWMNETTGEFNLTGLEWSTKMRGGMFYGRQLTSQDCYYSS